MDSSAIASPVTRAPSRFAKATAAATRAAQISLSSK
ncbi:MAG: hypothetical protein GQ535_04945 [Rhodobacteraceae bacterium]|nr:hypothetical protein [Paracoccaceae bacterium]